MRNHKIFKQAIVYLVIVIGFTLNAIGQTQKGTDIDGEAAGDYSGYSVCMPDANTVAIGAPFSANDSGVVRIYQWIGESWIKKGLDIEGEHGFDNSGWSVSMPDANTVAIGAPSCNEVGKSAGQVRIFSWNGKSWNQKGLIILEEGYLSYSGTSVSMPDQNTIVIGSPDFWGTGFMRIYTWNESSWEQKGLDIDYEDVYYQTVYSVCMPDANTVAIGAPFSANDSGTVRIYEWNGESWIKKGSNIVGETSGDQSGISISMPDANTVAIGAPKAMGETGKTRIYAWNGEIWIKKGLDIIGETGEDQSGISVSMPDANTIAIGAHANDGNGNNAGHVRIYSWNGETWVKNGSDIDGEAAEDQSGISVCMPDSKTLAIGASMSNGNKLPYSGQTRIYTLNETTGVSNPYDNFDQSVVVYPNPGNGELTIDLVSEYEQIEIKVFNGLGQEVQGKEFNHSKKLLFSIPGSAGIYFIHVKADKNSTFLKVTKV